MSALRPAVRFVSLLSALMLIPATALAQGQGNGGGNNKDEPEEALPPIQPMGPGGGSCPECTPTVLIAGGGTVYTPSINLKVYWCDDSFLQSETRWVKRNGTTITNQLGFGYTSGIPCSDTYKRISQGSVTLTPGSNTFTARICNVDENCANELEQVVYFYDPKPPPVVSTAPMNEGYRNATIEANSGFENVITYTSPGFVFKDTPFNLTFVYRSGSAVPRVLVQADVHPPTGAAAPAKYSMKVQLPGGGFATFLNTNTTEIFWNGAMATRRLAGVIDASSLATGAHNLTLLVRSHYGLTVKETTKTVRVLVVNESNSYIGRGWSIAGFQRAWEQSDGSVLVTEGDGSAIYFKKSGSSYITPDGDFSTLEDVGSDKWKRTYPDGTIVSFNQHGRQSHVEDRRGNKAAFPGAYDQLYAYYDVDDPTRRIALSYTDTTVTVTAQVPGGTRSAVFHKNTAGYVLSIEDPDGLTGMKLRYGGGRIDEVWDRRGNISGDLTNLTYDGLGYLKVSRLPAIDVGGQSVRPEIEQRSLAMVLGPDPASGLGSSGSPATALHPGSVKPWVEDPLDRRTTFTLDKFLAPKSIEEPLGRTTTFTRNQHSQVTKLLDPAGDSTKNVWSGPRLVSTYSQETGRLVSYDYANPPESNYHQPIKVSDNESSAPLFYSYDNDSQLDTVRVNNSTTGDVIASYEYTADGRVKVRRDAGDHETIFNYESGSYRNLINTERVGDSSSADTLTTRFGYTSYGRRMKVVSPKGDSTVTSFNVVDQPVWTINALGDTTHFAYDGYLLDEVEDAEGQVYAATHNALGWATESTDPRNGTTYFAYDEAGNVIESVNRLGDTITFAFDALNNLTAQVAGGDTIHAWTAADGMKSAVWNDASADTLEYDSEGRVTKQITRRGTRRYVVNAAFDAEGPRNRLWISVPGTISYDYRYTWNGEGQLALLEDRSSGVYQTQLRYNPHRQLDTILVANMKQTFTYSGLHPPVQMKFSRADIDDAFGYTSGLEENTGRIASVRYGDGDTLRAYGYDKIGQITESVDSELVAGEPVCIDYDPVYGWICSGHQTQWDVMTADTMQYDAVGNREDSGTSISNGNRLTAFDGYSFTYDDEGRNLTKTKSGFAQTYYWNALSQLDSVTTVSTGDTTVVRYMYDGLGRRISRDGPSGFEEYIFDGSNLILVLDDTAGVKSRISYYPGVDRPHSVRANTQLYYFATDHTGSVIGLYKYNPSASPQQTVENRYRYDLWGRPQGPVTETVENPLRFKSRPYDEDTGLSDFRNRWYDPETGRFISEDPIGIAGGINVYRFVGNDPVGGWDPFGLSEDGPCEEDEGIQAAGGYYEFTPSLIADDLNGGGYWNWVGCEESAGSGSGEGSSGLWTHVYVVTGTLATGPGFNFEMGVAWNAVEGSTNIFTLGYSGGWTASLALEYALVRGGLDAIGVHSRNGYVEVEFGSMIAGNFSFMRESIGSLGFSVGLGMPGSIGAVNTVLGSWKRSPGGDITSYANPCRSHYRSQGGC